MKPKPHLEGGIPAHCPAGWGLSGANFLSRVGPTFGLRPSGLHHAQRCCLSSRAMVTSAKEYRNLVVCVTIPHQYAVLEDSLPDVARNL